MKKVLRVEEKFMAFDKLFLGLSALNSLIAGEIITADF